MRYRATIMTEYYGGRHPTFPVFSDKELKAKNKSLALKRAKRLEQKENSRLGNSRAGAKLVKLLCIIQPEKTVSIKI